MDKPRLWYVNVFVSDFDRSVAFYRDVIGFDVVIEDANFGYASFATEGAGFAIAKAQPEQSALTGRHTGIGWGVPDVDAAHRQLADRGVEFEQPPEKQPWGGYMAIFKDPDGNTFYLDQLPEHAGG